MLDNILATVLLSIVIILGLFGNCLNLIILSRRSMKFMSTFRFMYYLSIVDMLVLTTCCTDALLTYGFNYEIRLISTFLCKFHTFLTYDLTHMSSMILMSASIDRLLIVCNESIDVLFKKIRRGRPASFTASLIESSEIMKSDLAKSVMDFLKKKRVNFIIILISLIIGLVNIHFLLLIDINILSVSDGNQSVKVYNRISSFLKEVNASLTSDDPHYIELIIPDLNLRDEEMLVASAQHIFHNTFIKVCFPISRDTNYFIFLERVWIWIDVSFYCLIPFAVMIICSIGIFIEIENKTKQFIRLFLAHNEKMLLKRIRRKRQVFLMISVTNVFFIICSLPYCIITLRKKFGFEINQSFFFLIHFLAYLNNAVNFIIFGLFSSKYRNTLFGLLGCKRTKAATRGAEMINQNNALDHQETQKQASLVENRSLKMSRIKLSLRNKKQQVEYDPNNDQSFFGIKQINDSNHVINSSSSNSYNSNVKKAKNLGIRNINPQLMLETSI